MAANRKELKFTYLGTRIRAGRSGRQLSPLHKGTLPSSRVSLTPVGGGFDVHDGVLPRSGHG